MTHIHHIGPALSIDYLGWNQIVRDFIPFIHLYSYIYTLNYDFSNLNKEKYNNKPKGFTGQSSR